MTYAIKPLPCDPARIKGMPERLIVSHHPSPRSRCCKGALSRKSTPS